jgi:hypothetical protein
MRKRILTTTPNEPAEPATEWLDLEALAAVELDSEDPGYPVESALVPGRSPGWRAAVPGRQTIRLRFDHPQQLRRIHLDFEETGIERTQEYVLRWSGDGGQTFREIVRQQWNFTPAGASCESEDHFIELPAVTVLELSIIPDISGGAAVASLARLRLA